MAHSRHSFASLASLAFAFSASALNHATYLVRSAVDGLSTVGHEASRAMDALASVLHRIKAGINYFVGSFLTAFSQPMPSAPPMMLVKAKQYTQRIDKRERPQITASYRRCPSV